MILLSWYHSSDQCKHYWLSWLICWYDDDIRAIYQYLYSYHIPPSTSCHVWVTRTYRDHIKLEWALELRNWNSKANSNPPLWPQEPFHIWNSSFTSKIICLKISPIKCWFVEHAFYIWNWRFTRENYFCIWRLYFT